jgi:WD40 repeat protein
MRILKNPDGFADHLEFSADSRWLMAARHSIRLWEMPAAEGRPLLESGRVLAARMAGADLAVAYGGRPSDVRRLALPGGEALQLATFAGWTSNLMSVSLPAGRLAVVDASSGAGGIRLWTWPDLAPLPPQSAPLGGKLRDLRYSPDGKWLALMDSAERVIVRTAAGELAWQKRITGRLNYGRLAWSPDGRFLAAASGIHLTILGAAKGEVLASLRLKIKYYQDIAFTADSRFLAAVSNEKTVKVYETATWSLSQELAWDIGKLACITFSPDGMLGAVGNSGRKVLVWDVDW